MPIDKDTKMCMSLSGRPGNFGTRFHNHLYGQLGLNYIYKAFSTTDLPAAIAGIRALGIRGCAVSMPFKEACIPLVDSVHPSAASIQSINTIVNDNGVLHAYNTDYIAVFELVKNIPPSTSFILRGSGGMAKAVVAALHDSGFRNGIIVARNERAGSELARAYGYKWSSDLADSEADMLVNVTPIGMAGGIEEHYLAFPETAVQHSQFVFDVVALPVETPLIKLARRLNRTVISGAEVIVLQAVEQFVMYTGVRPNDQQIETAAAHARV
eukprot:TRINITY_DN8673_c0_g1_i1.p1 TRINITY_DN8673_c0_g1~~TRINITY_DN8673_c0_g1_i1.p1  ORF type:complete len:269 (+),score=9.38 TRINITY_DN8673_c0_g1_i1:62-868(+)